jgi:hypothetical protein
MAHYCPDCLAVCRCDEWHKLPIVMRFLAAIDCVHRLTRPCRGHKPTEKAA